MNRFVALIVLLSIGELSCQSPEKQVNHLELTEAYYKTLDNSSFTELKILLNDSLKTIDDGYVQTFTKPQLIDWLQWDEVFKPTYKILEIKQNQNVVYTKVSKIDKRILFLHKKPIVTQETIKFNNNKITSVDRNSIVFDVDTFVKNRDKLVDWIDKNHPELNGFINDQTQAGGIKYLKAIALYKNKNDSIRL
ncbi:hypothetical protein HX109_01525 [Galbibacter sp. BG1]|uniref:hypothetical protein n=1 Tax=Galbibacter sp. BG1 TaxID=1170699 RepID=UPI0015C0FD06|nr:hypothetical protein [Galbibacter sp. BG1]QLE00307.1 hypothetical protein HX109_01525 [Galbibacter sp. BG1]